MYWEGYVWALVKVESCFCSGGWSRIVIVAFFCEGGDDLSQAVWTRTIIGIPVPEKKDLKLDENASGLRDD